MRAFLAILVVAVLCCARNSTADVVEGNPDQRASIYVGFRAGWGEYSLLEGGVEEPLFELDRDFRHLVGELVIPATRSMSFQLGANYDVSSSADSFQTGEFYSRQNIDTIEVGLRFFLP